MTDDMKKLAQYRAECEARYWVAQYRKLEAKEGRDAARRWWQDTLDLLMRKRSQTAVDELRRMMNDKVYPYAPGSQGRR